MLAHRKRIFVVGLSGLAAVLLTGTAITVAQVQTPKQAAQEKPASAAELADRQLSDTRARLGAADLASAFRLRISRRPALATVAALGLVLLLAVWPNHRQTHVKRRADPPRLQRQRPGFPFFPGERMPMFRVRLIEDAGDPDRSRLPAGT